MVVYLIHSSFYPSVKKHDLQIKLFVRANIFTSESMVRKFQPFIIFMIRTDFIVNVQLETLSPTKTICPCVLRAAPVPWPSSVSWWYRTECCQSPGKVGANLSGATVLTWANSAQRKCPTYCFWKLGCSPSFLSLHGTFFGHHKCNFNNRLLSIIIPIGSIFAVVGARVLIFD